ncbi:hypothetical protein BKA70DRAFT_1031243, partial [Coprinopsis sp. MPI-PUGE-AT-0042]
SPSPPPSSSESSDDDDDPITFPLPRHLHNRPANMGLADVKVNKIKDCPMLTEGTLDPERFHTWVAACNRYKKFGKIADDEIVSHVADAMMEPRLMQWYQAGQARIDKLSLQDYYKELAVIMLEENWDHKLWEEILSARQGNREFLSWKIEIENKNVILTNAVPEFSLSPEALKAQLEANLNADLKLDLLNDPVKEKDLAKWSSLVKIRDDKLRAEGEKIKKAIASNDALKAQRRDERRTLASRLTSPPPKTA